MQYDWNSFVADFGGYLGLLLGHSMIAFFDMAADYLDALRNFVVRGPSGGRKKITNH